MPVEHVRTCAFLVRKSKQVRILSLALKGMVMNPIKRCLDCDRWRYIHARSEIISNQDAICAMCQATFVLTAQNDELEGTLVAIKAWDMEE